MVKICASAASTASSGSASSKTTTGDLPPSSTDERLSVGAPAAITRLPVEGSPVKQIRFTPGCEESGAPAVSPAPCTTLQTPPGRPAAASAAGGSDREAGAHAERLSTTGVPAGSAGASRQVESISGAFQGMINPVTPAGL